MKNEISFMHSRKNVDDFWLKFWDLSGAKECKSCRYRQELSNEYLLAKIGVDTAENEPLKVRRKIQSIFHSPLSWETHRTPSSWGTWTRTSTRCLPRSVRTRVQSSNVISDDSKKVNDLMNPKSIFSCFIVTDQDWGKMFLAFWA